MPLQRNSMERKRLGCIRYKAALLSVVLLCETLARPMILCGPNSDSLTPYYLDEHRCVNGTLIAITTSPITETATTMKVTTTGKTQTSTSKVNTHIAKPRFPPPRFQHPRADRQCKNNKPAQTCNGEPVCGRYKCCGGQFIYHPGFATCCTVMHKAVVHQMHAEREHACCGTDVYTRGRQPCLHESQNDRLWDAHPTLDNRAVQDLCTADFVYVLRTIRKTSNGEREVILRQLKPGTKKNLRLPLAVDKYTPRGKVIKDSIVLLTKSDRYNERTFYTYTNDQLYKLKGQLKMKLIRRTLRNCRRRLYS